MADRIPPPLPNKRLAELEQSAQSKPYSLPEVQKTQTDSTASVQGVSSFAELVERHIGSDSKITGNRLPASIPTLPPETTENSFPATPPEFPQPESGSSLQPSGWLSLLNQIDSRERANGFLGYPAPDSNQSMGGFFGFPAPDWGMGPGFDPNLFAGFGYDPKSLDVIDPKKL